MKYKIANKTPEALWINENLLIDRIDNSYYRLEFIESDLKNKNIPIKLMKDILKSNITDFGSFSLTKEIEYVKQGIPYIRSSDFKEFFIEEDNIYFITENVNKILSKSEVFEGDILITKMGSDMGKAAFISKLPFGLEKCNSNATIAKVRVKDEYDKHYIVAYLNSKYAVNNVWRNAVGSVQPRVNLSDIENYIIAMPSPEIQKYIGDKIRKADELREEAKRLKKEAEKIFNENYQQVIKKGEKHEWLKADYLSEDNVIPNFYKQYDLLKDKKHVYIEFENIVDSIKCGIPVRSDMRIGSSYPFYGASGITDNIDDYNFDGEYLIVAQDGSVGSVNIARDKFWANNHVWVVQVREEWDLEFLELYMQKYNYWISLTTGSVVPKVTSENLKRLLVPKIEYQIQEEIGKRIRESKDKEKKSNIFIKQAKQDVEDLIDGNFDMSKN